MVDRWFSPGNLVSSTNITHHHDITEILLKVVLNPLKQTKPIISYHNGTGRLRYSTVKDDGRLRYSTVQELVG